jgi:hypothetical protein
MQIRVKGMTLVKSGRSWTEFLVEHETTRGWRVLTTLKSRDEVMAFLATRPEDDPDVG